MALSTAREIYEALVSGTMAAELQRHVEQLPWEERQNLLRVLWCMRDEVAEDSQDRAVEIDHIVANNCPVYTSASYRIGLPGRIFKGSGQRV